MGRGRARAKQAKVARELKYSSPQTDLAALQRELSGDRHAVHTESSDDEYGYGYDERYSEAGARD